MKKTLLVTTGLVAGFMLGAMTPLGNLGSLDNVRILLSKSGRLAAFVGAPRNELDSLTHFQSLIARAGAEPAGNILQNQEITLAAGFIDPQSAWSMQFADIVSSTGVRQASFSNDIVAPDELKRGDTGGGNIGQSAPRLNMPDVPDENVWHARTSAVELARLTATIAEIEIENAAILGGLPSTEETHPDYHMALCIFESNDGLMAFYSFLVKMGEEGAVLSDTQALSQALETERRETASHARSGRTTAKAWRFVLEGLPAQSPSEEHIKKLALEYYDSFLLSFDVEETLATHLTAYPELIRQAIETGEPPYAVSTWVEDFQELGRSRMELQAFRQSITQQLAGPNV